MRIISLLTFAFGVHGQCAKNFHLDLAILLDAGESEEIFDVQRNVTQKILQWLPNTEDRLRVSLVPYSWKLFRPTNNFNEKVAKEN